MLSTDTILLAEDDRLDQKSIRRALAELNIPNPLVSVENGKAALDFLRTSSKIPALILLDLNMPEMGGLEFLKVIKQDDRFKKIPVVVITSSRRERDIEESFGWGAAGFMPKPIEHKQFVEIMGTIYLYWELSLGPPRKG